MSYSATIDVDDLERGVRFYCHVFGFREAARPMPIYAVLDTGGQRLGIMEKPAGSRPSPATDDLRRYERHWTPVHLDFEVTDIDATLARLKEEGGTVETLHPGTETRPAVAFCADAFGNGLCILGPRSGR